MSARHEGEAKPGAGCLMTDPQRIRELEQAVIEAARLLKIQTGDDAPDHQFMHGGSWESLRALKDSLTALDKAQEPDPWALLRGLHDSGLIDGPDDRIREVAKALEWAAESVDRSTP